MNREDYLDSLKSQFAEQIHELFVECEHKSGKEVDWPHLNECLVTLMRSAVAQGFPSGDFHDLVKSRVPGAEEHFSFFPKSKAA